MNDSGFTPNEQYFSHIMARTSYNRWDDSIINSTKFLHDSADVHEYGYRLYGKTIEYKCKSCDKYEPIKYDVCCEW
jgi:hypothetical protein